jgi:2-methylisocitrate lyase-like PEP mutase family enzyme
MANPKLRKMLADHEFFVAPGVYDMMSTLMANRVGFDCVYASGYWLTASYLGIPDAGLATFTDMLNRVSRVVELSDAPVIADADTGFGGLLNVQQTVRGYERAGVSGIQIEDQEFPKKCGHTPYRRVVPVEDMVGKLQVALDSRQDENLLIIARTDSRTGYGLQEAIGRAQAFAKTGVDLVFVESLESREEMRIVCEEVDVPLIANMSNGGKTPMCSARELVDLGYACAIFPALAALAANAAAERALRNLRENGSGVPTDVPLFDFQEFCLAIGFDEVWAFEEKWSDLLNKK